MSDVEFQLKSNTARLLREAKDKPDFLIPVDSPCLRSLKNLVRHNESSISDYVAYLFGSLASSSSESRVSVLSLFNYFFTRSHLFRLKTVDRLQELLRLCCEIDPLRYPLPPPKESALILKVYGIKTVKQWHEGFGSGYDKLQNVVEFLKLSKCVDLERATAEVQAERDRQEVKRRKEEERAAKIAVTVLRKFNSSRDEFERCLTEVDMALKILVPSFEDAEVTSSTGTSKLNHMDMSRLHCLDQNADISIFIPSSDANPTVLITDENDAVVQSVVDGRVMLDVHRSLLAKWLQTLTKYGCEQNVMKEFILMKGRLDRYILKIDDLKLKKAKKKIRCPESSDDDSDLEDVPEKEVEEFIAPYEVPEYIMKKIAAEQKEENQPCCSKSLDDSQPQIEPKEPVIPVLPFGLDLKYWGEGKRGPVEIPKNDADSHRFWRSADDEGTHKESASIYETRVFTFVGGERRSTKQCRTPLPSGKLCPRMDFDKCPLHGLIIERDDAGFPLIEQPPDSQDNGQMAELREEEEYLRDLETATGVSFSPTKPSKSKRKKSSSVPDGRAIRQRLEKKLLDKSAIIRVSKVLDSVRKAKIQKKFGSQFAHSLTK